MNRSNESPYRFVSARFEEAQAAMLAAASPVTLVSEIAELPAASLRDLRTKAYAHTTEQIGFTVNRDPPSAILDFSQRCHVNRMRTLRDSYQPLGLGCPENRRHKNAPRLGAKAARKQARILFCTQYAREGNQGLSIDRQHRAGSTA